MFCRFFWIIHLDHISVNMVPTFVQFWTLCKKVLKTFMSVFFWGFCSSSSTVLYKAAFRKVNNISFDKHFWKPLTGAVDTAASYACRLQNWAWEARTQCRFESWDSLELSAWNVIPNKIFPWEFWKALVGIENMKTTSLYSTTLRPF